MRFLHASVPSTRQIMMRDLQSIWRQKHKRSISITGSLVAEAAQKEKDKPPSDPPKPTGATKKRKRTAVQKKSAPAVRKSVPLPPKATSSAASSRPALPAITAFSLPVGVAHISSVDEGDLSEHACTQLRCCQKHTACLDI